MVHDPDPLKRLDTALGVGRRRLRLRGALRGAVRGAWVGAGLAVVVALVRQIGFLEDLAAGIAAVLALGLCTAIGTVAGALWKTLEDRETALLLDRAFDTDELLVTATWLRSSPPTAKRDAILEELGRARLPPVDRALPLRVPKHSRWLALPLAIALLGLVLPAWRPALWLRAQGSDQPLVQEGSRLAERVAEGETSEAAPLPDGIEREIADLARDMQGETLSPEEAMERLEEMQAQLDAFEEAMAQQKDVLEDLEKAAEALDKSPFTKDLADALQDVDMGAAGEAAQKLADELGMKSPAEREQAADALEQAGKQLAQSGDPSMQQAGEALEQAAKAARGESGEQGSGEQQGEGEQGEGQQGEGSAGQQGGEGGLSKEDAEQLAKALEQARSAGDQLARDKEALERSQELNGALEGSRQRLGGDPSVDEGEGEGDGEGESGNQSGDGEGNGQGENAGEGEGEGSGAGMGQAGSGAGQGHTWEDQGEFDKPEGGDDNRGDRTNDRDEGQVINDFERLYRSVRDEDAEHLLTSVKGAMDESGHVDELPIRLTTSDETAQTAAVQLPAGYREAAAEAVTSEQVPPGYREAVKQYFDEME